MDNIDLKPQSLKNSPEKHYMRSLKTNLGKIVRRTLDICASLAGLIILSPIFLLIAVLIKRDSPGPVIFRGLRAGKEDRDFHILKFRTMYERPESYQGSRVTAQDDPRITRLGGWLRDTKLNELPQLWNVFKGEMSLVGPRPEDPEIAAGWPEEVRREVLSVRPGITSPASVLFRDEEAQLQSQDVMTEYLREIQPSKLRLDQLYIRYRTLLADMDILLMTFLVMLPRVSSWSVPEHLLFWGPFSFFVNSILVWFLVDLLVCIGAVAVTGVIWRIGAPLDLGIGLAAGIALSIAMLFSLINLLTGVNRTSWSRARTSDGLGLAVSCGLATAIIFLFNMLLPTSPLLPPGMIIVTGVFSYIGFIAVRYRGRLFEGLLIGWLNLRTGSMRSLGERVLIVGAGEMGQLTTWLLRNENLARSFSTIGMVDDDPRKVRTRMDGCEIIGTTKDIPGIVEKYDVGLLMYAISSSTPEDQQRILSICQSTPARIVQVPGILHIMRAQFLSEGDERDQLFHEALHAATIDGLTGVYNRNHFLNLTERELRRARRYGHSLSLLILAVDYAKPDIGSTTPVNYTQVIKSVAQRLLRFTREPDIIGRFADREFIFALPETNSSETQIVVERLQECLTGTPIQTEGGPIDVTIRMADVTTNGSVSDLDSLIERTQAALE